MVLQKRKIIKYASIPENIQEDQQVWYIPITQEVFTEYDDYLTRMDFYNEKIFMCEITGHTNMTYFQAYQSELMHARDIEETFPESLKEPVLRKIQLSLTTRIDYLVDEIYDQFKKDYYPGESLICTLAGEKWEVQVREKTKFNEIISPNGIFRPAHTKYLVEMPEKYKKEDTREEMVDEKVLSRERGSFTKAILRAFIKNVVKKESWTGAPWIIKEKYAKRFKIDIISPKLRKEEIERQLHKKKMEIEGVVGKNARGYPLKYPIEDLDLVPASNVSHRPEFIFETLINKNSISVLLETWTFLNVFCEPLILDSFTLDDYIDSLHYTSLNPPCELINETHCSLLKSLVGERSPLCLSSCMSPSKKEVFNKINVINNNYIGNFGENWRELLQRRILENGKWIIIVIGIINELLKNSLYPEKYDLILKKFNVPHIKESYCEVYYNLNSDDKLRVLEILIELCYNTPLTRNYIEECSESIIQAKKDKQELIKTKKQHLEKIREIRDEIRKLFPGGIPRLEQLSPLEEQMDEETEDEDEEMHENFEPDDQSITNTEDNVLTIKTRSRSGVKRKRTFEEPKIKSQLPDAKTLKQHEKLTQEIKKIKRQIQKIEEDMVINDVNIREADAQRVRVLGYDRFWNRYWWLENNGMPYYGMPDSSTSYAGYATGRIWIQGPSPDIIEKFRQDKILERKQIEEGKTPLASFNDWAYIDTPEKIEELLNWLNPKGIRELKLKNVIQARINFIYQAMDARKKYLSGELIEAKRSTRATLGIDYERERFLNWVNSKAIEYFGCGHSHLQAKKERSSNKKK
ncbi:hypothetical protein PNEG_01772 [Pneumocystis murina B123]|uniref:WAC domain-containing protein n=1 Tax=Pneumocystis murina (strain B123) TaxID=1069680 RepID=M7NRW1_PNEMU|nr:hypothetical protein PNEG_01772 [Pneumocystis murina B123]EMR10017.1 hypothetical protein PNEG_01772 [Pneumocystis murina B123]